MAFSPITSWQIKGGKVEAVTDFIFLGSKITVDSTCSPGIKKALALYALTQDDIACSPAYPPALSHQLLPSLCPLLSSCSLPGGHQGPCPEPGPSPSLEEADFTGQAGLPPAGVWLLPLNFLLAP